MTPAEICIRCRLTDHLTQADLDTALAVLPPGELARHERLRVSRDRDEFAIAHALLRTTLSEFGAVAPADWKFAAGLNGKPEIAPGQTTPPLSFNLSHSHGLVACVVASGAAGRSVGIDGERTTRSADWEGIARHYFAAGELAQIDAAPPHEQAAVFFELWTLKEAFLKALGVGLSQPLSASCFVLHGTDGITWTPPAGTDPAPWQFALYKPTPDHRLAVAVCDRAPAWPPLARLVAPDGVLAPIRSTS
jgi:4'-phosphopantetheinyl transferase